MKVEVMEHDGCFGIDIRAENVAEAALLTRMGVNSRVEKIRHDLFVQQSSGTNGEKSTGTFTMAVVLQKNKRGSSQIPRRR
jgi:hypothetical protein